MKNKRKANDADSDRPMKRRSTRVEQKIVHQKRKEILCDKCMEITPGGRYRNSNPTEILLSRPVIEIIGDALAGCKGCIFFCLFLMTAMNLGSIACLDARKHDEVFRNHLVLEQHSWARLGLRASGLLAQALELEACEVSGSFIINDTRTRSTLERIAEKSCRPLHSKLWDDDGGLGRVPRPVCLSPISPETLAIISLWLRMCSTHARCRPVEDEVLPTRVLDVSSPGSPKLIKAQGMRGQYVILSHCWGPANGMYKTTKERVLEHEKGFRHECLSQNFLDAILFTERLGFKYLWIDALCIVQDDPDDWNHEASLMGAYYNRSALMLSASAAPHCHAGFLLERRTLYSPPFGVDRWYCLRSPLYQEHEIERFPISQRAWTMQERYLAPRVLHFLPDQLFFECGSSSYSEGYFKNRVRELEPFTKTRIQFIIERDISLHEDRKRWPDATDYLDVDFLYKQWYECVANFTSRNITFPSDRLPAISGLAKKFAHPKIGRYFAGHWQQDLFRSLSWFVPREPSPRALNACQNSAVYRAPSWSWASIDSAVRVGNTLWWSPKRGESPCTSQVEELRHWERQYSPSLVGVEISNSSVDAYTSVGTGSFIEIEAFCRSLFLAAMPIGNQGPDGPGGTFVKEIYLDLEDRSLCYLEKPQDYHGEVREVIMVQVCKDRRGDRNVYALLLEPERHGCYRRIGLATLGNYNLGDFLQPQNGIVWAFHMHPRQRDGKLDELRTQEWGATKWTQRRLKLV